MLYSWNQYNVICQLYHKKKKKKKKNGSSQLYKSKRTFSDYIHSIKYMPWFEQSLMLPWNYPHSFWHLLHSLFLNFLLKHNVNIHTRTHTRKAWWIFTNRTDLVTSIQIKKQTLWDPQNIPHVPCHYSLPSVITITVLIEIEYINLVSLHSWLSEFRVCPFFVSASFAQHLIFDICLLLYIVIDCLFSFLHFFPFCEFVTVYLYILLLMRIWIVSSFCLHVYE